MRHIVGSAMFLAALVLAAAASAKSDDFNRSFALQFDRRIPVEYEKGPLDIGDVEFTRKKGVTVLPLGNRSADEAYDSLTAEFRFDNESRDDDYDVTIRMEFLDRDGKMIDVYETEREFDAHSHDQVTVSFPFLRYAIPLVAKVKLSLWAHAD